MVTGSVTSNIWSWLVQSCPTLNICSSRSWTKLRRHNHRQSCLRNLHNPTTLPSAPKYGWPRRI